MNHLRVDQPLLFSNKEVPVWGTTNTHYESYAMKIAQGKKANRLVFHHVVFIANT